MAFTVSYTYKAIDKFTAPLAKMAKEVDRMTARMGAAMNRVSASMMGVDKTASRARSSVANLGKVNGQLQGMALNAERYAAAMKRVGSVRIPAMPTAGAAVRGGRGGRRGMDAVDGMVAGGSALGITAGLAAAARSSMALEDSLLDVRRLSDLDPAGMAQFDAMTQRLSQGLRMSRTELNQMAASAMSAGVPLEEMEKFLSFASKAAVAADFGSAQEAGEVLGTIKAQLGISVEEMMRLGDQVNIVADRTNTTSQKMLDVLERGAGVISGWSTESQTAMAGFFSNLEPRSEKAATAMNAMVTKLKTMGGTISKVMMQDGVKGLRMYFATLSRIKDPIKIQQRLLKDFGQEHVDVAAKAMGRISELDGLLTMVASNEAVGSLGREYELSMSGMKGATSDFGAAWENLKATVFDKGVGAGFIMSLATAVQHINAFADANPRLTQFITMAAGATAAALALGGAIALVNVAMAPLMAIGAGVIAAVGAVAAGLLLAWTYCEPLRDQLSALGKDFEFLMPAVDAVSGVLGFLFKLIGKAVGTVLLIGIGAIRTLLNNFKTVATVLGAVLTGNWGDVPGILSEAGSKNLEIGNETWAAMSDTWSSWDGAGEPLGGSPPINLVKGGQVVSGPNASPVERAEAARQQVVATSGVAGQGTGAGGYPSPPMKLDITVHSDPGTSASVKKANMPVGTNIRGDR